MGTTGVKTKAQNNRPISRPTSFSWSPTRRKTHRGMISNDQLNCNFLIIVQRSRILKFLPEFRLMNRNRAMSVLVSNMRFFDDQVSKWDLLAARCQNRVCVCFGVKIVLVSVLVSKNCWSKSFLCLLWCQNGFAGVKTIVFFVKVVFLCFWMSKSILCMFWCQIYTLLTATWHIRSRGWCKKKNQIVFYFCSFVMCCVLLAWLLFDCANLCHRFK